MAKPKYDIVINEETYHNIKEYQQNLISGKEQPGAFLQAKLTESGKSIKDFKTAEFVEIMLKTKQPQFFAESAIKGGGKDWNNSELRILGDINVTVPVKIHDNGVWNPKDKDFKVHSKPLDGELLFTPGALLKNGTEFAGKTPDFTEVTKNGKIDQEAYNKLIERRLLPLLVHANEQAKKDGKPAVITMPGIGAGEFAGEFKGKMGEHLNQAMQVMLEKHASKLTNIAAIHYDSFNECDNQQKNFGNIQYRVRPSLKEGNADKQQLSTLSDLEDKKGEFKNCKIYKIVAWDHVSLPGNDYFAGIRHTDDGASAAATNSMHSITGIKGIYNSKTGQYSPPKAPEGEKPYRNWRDVVSRAGIHLIAKDNIKIISNEAKSYSLKEFEKYKATPQKSVVKQGFQNLAEGFTAEYKEAKQNVSNLKNKVKGIKKDDVTSKYKEVKDNLKKVGRDIKKEAQNANKDIKQSFNDLKAEFKKSVSAQNVSISTSTQAPSKPVNEAPIKQNNKSFEEQQKTGTQKSTWIAGYANKPNAVPPEHKVQQQQKASVPKPAWMVDRPNKTTQLQQEQNLKPQQKANVLKPAWMVDRPNKTTQLQQEQNPQQQQQKANVPKPAWMVDRQVKPQLPEAEHQQRQEAVANKIMEGMKKFSNPGPRELAHNAAHDIGVKLDQKNLVDHSGKSEINVPNKPKVGKGQISH